jgi:hypothetical protein
MKPIFKIQKTPLSGCLLFFICLFIQPQISNAQYIHFDENGNKITVWEYYDEQHGHLLRKDSLIEFKEGGKMETKIYFLYGDTVNMFQNGQDADGKKTFEREKGFDNNGHVKADNMRWFNPSGLSIRKKEYNPATGEYEEWVRDSYKWVRVAENRGTDSRSSSSSLFRNQNCNAGIAILVGTSFVMADFGMKRQCLPGIQLSAIRNITPHINISLSAGLNTKKFGKEGISRRTVMIDGSYLFGDDEDCDREWLTDIHVMVGMVHEKFGYSKGSGATCGTGVGITRRVTEKIGVKVQADFFGLKWKNSPSLNTEYRMALGAQYRF